MLTLGSSNLAQALALSILVASLAATSACAPAVAASGRTSFEERRLAPVGRQSPSDRLVLVVVHAQAPQVAGQC